MEILKIKDSQGNWIEVPAIIGPKGDQGEPGLQGATGDKGADGFSPIAKVETIPNGATITITDKNGTTTATILNGAKGDPGTNGTTPVKGVDYYTDADKQEMVQLVLAAIPSSEEVNY